MYLGVSVSGPKFGVDQNVINAHIPILDNLLDNWMLGPMLHLKVSMNLACAEKNLWRLASQLSVWFNEWSACRISSTCRMLVLGKSSTPFCCLVLRLFYLERCIICVVLCSKLFWVRIVHGSCVLVAKLYIFISIAHRITNPLRRTSEHITLHDLKH